MKKIKAGLLPLYIKLYDDASPEMRPRVEQFLHEAKTVLETRGLEIISAPVCRIEPEFRAAVTMFEEKAVDVIITLHLAYSPSLESIEAISATGIPLIVFDTTPAYVFDASTDPEEISYNHGIHGVQDMCNMLLRHGKEFFIETGHLYESDVADRVAACAKACGMAAAMRGARVGSIGGSFKGMGDFAVPLDVLKSKIGMEVVYYDFKNNDSYKATVTEEDIQKEIAFDKKSYDVQPMNAETYKQSTIANLMTRNWVEKEALTALTVNFLNITKDCGIPCVPFMEASKGMARGIGYAGEGDVLTAALVGAMMSVSNEVTFTEMFCPNWKDNTIFLSHMGEMNLNLSDEKPHVVEKDFPYTDAGNPAVAYGRFKGGDAVFVNLSPRAGDRFALILSKIRLIDLPKEDKMSESIHGWFAPEMPVADFLQKFSLAGGTHHSAIMYGDHLKELEMFAKLMKWEVVKI